MRGRYVAALVAAAAVAFALLWHSRTVTTNPPAASPTATENRGVLVISPTEDVPSDLAGVRYLLLDGSKASKIGALKQRYPGLKVLAYKDLSFFVDYSTNDRGNAAVPWSQASLNESWFLHDPGGSRVRSIRYPHSWFADVGQASYQTAWELNVLSFLRKAPWDGVFIDDALADPGWHLGGAYGRLARYPSRDAYRAAERSMLAATAPHLQRAGYLVIANIAASRRQLDVWSDWPRLLSGAMREHFLKYGKGGERVLTGKAWRHDVAIERAVEGVGRVFIGLSYGPRRYAKAQGFVRASFLLFDDPETRSATIWSPEAGKAAKLDLGLPQGPPVRHGKVWTRPFQRGTLRVNPRRGTYAVKR